MEQGLKQQLNQLNLKGLEKILCGDSMHYIETWNKKRHGRLKAFLRILIGIFGDRCSVKTEGTGNIMFLFSNSYATRKDMRMWFDEVCSIVQDRTIVVPQNISLNIGHLKRIFIFFSWYRESRKIELCFSERMYYLSKLFMAASDLWQVQEYIKKNVNAMPSLFISVCDVHMEDSLFTQYFNNMHIDTASLQHGFITRKYNEWTITGSKSKYYLIYGEYTKNQCLRMGIPDKKLIKLGMPQYLNSDFSREYVDPKKNVFGVILSGENYLTEDLKMLEMAELFSIKTGSKYCVKIHPGLKREIYGNKLNSPNVSRVFSNEINVREFGENVLFTLIGKSVVFMEYMLNLYPVFLYRENLEDDLFEEIEWCKIGNEKDLGILYDRFMNDRNWFINKMKETRAFLCENNSLENYKSFFMQYEKQLNGGIR